MSTAWSKRIPWILGIAYWMLMIINHRFNMWDFKVYYSAAEAFIHGEPVYGQAFGLGSGFYKYSPFAVLPFIPLAILPYFWAQTIYYFLLLGLIIRSVQVWNDQMRRPNAKWTIGTTTVLTLLFFGDHLERELFLGNVNFLLLAILFWVWKNYKAQKWRVAGVLLAVVILFKPHFVILIPLLIIAKQWEWLKFWAISVLAFLVLPLFLVGPLDGWQMTLDWMATMKTHNVELYNSPNTLYGLFNHLVAVPLGWNLKSKCVLLILMLLGVFGGFLWIKKFKSGKWPLTYAFIALIALVPSLTHTDTEHFLFSIPIFVFWLNSYSRDEKWGVDGILICLAFIPFTLNSPDLVGKSISHFFDEEGGIGVANVLLITAYFLRLNRVFPNH
ncbi:MAG: hypothetical protein RL062_242 [Bacteroidota bacterium]